MSFSFVNATQVSESASEDFFSSVPVSCAVLCVDCERITVSHNDACPVCGGKSLLNVATILGGTLTGERVRKIEPRLEIVRCA
jgi:hypothetical protein